MSEERGDGEDDTNDMTMWRNLFTPDPVIKALSELGFSEPTQIQVSRFLQD